MLPVSDPAMTYLQFHLVFTIPVVVILKMTGPRILSRDVRKATISLVAIAVIAFVWTVPWDNYLVHKGIWGYGHGRVLGTWGYVPYEEYFFFVIQPILTGLWLYHLLWRRSAPSGAPSQGARIVGSVLFFVLSVVGVLLLNDKSTLYLGLILVWASPLLTIQWMYGGHHLWRLREIWFLATALPTVYLWIADWLALQLGIWFISDTYTLGIHFFGLPFEEALFFLVTNLLVVQGLLLFLHTWNVDAVTQPASLARRLS